MHFKKTNRRQLIIGTLSLMTLTACGGGSNEAPTSNSHLYQSLQQLRVGMTVQDASNIIGRWPDESGSRMFRWLEGDERLILTNVVDSSSPLSYLQWTWAGGSATYIFKGDSGSKPTLLTTM
ncbi:hypothetical protein [Hydrogenophaga sp. MI9]|uniref:hypothetical protein n=1 Tax=Hydrogenophaga sp. MI9 TaxID=3453719 RepID=UPI003EEB8C2F